MPQSKYPRIKFGACDLCTREKSLSFHHLIPRTNHSNKWFQKNFDRYEMENRGINLCSDCHHQVHRVIGKKDLGRYYNTRETLLSHEEIKKFVDWVKTR